MSCVLWCLQYSTGMVGMVGRDVGRDGGGLQSRLRRLRGTVYGSATW